MVGDSKELFAVGALSEIMFRRLVAASRVVMVQAVAPAERGRGGFTGAWEIYAQTVGEERWMMLTNSRPKGGTFRPKRFVTVNGVVGFLQDLGFMVAALPLVAGERIVLRESGGSLRIKVLSDLSAPN